MVWYGMVGMLKCIKEYFLIPYGMHGMARYGMLCYGIHKGLTWYGMVWYGMVLLRMSSYGMLHFNPLGVYCMIL